MMYLVVAASFFRSRPAGVRVHGAFRSAPDRKGQLDQPPGLCIERTGLSHGFAERRIRPPKLLARVHQITYGTGKFF